MKLKENKKTYVILFFVLFFVSFLLSIFVEHTSGIHGRGDLLAPGSLTWEEIFKNIRYYIFVNLFGVSLMYFLIFFPFKKNKGNLIKGKYDIVKERVHNREKYASPPKRYECRICGYKNEDFPWGEDGKTPNYQICPCCGTQFGVNDITLDDIHKTRNLWKKNGNKWFAKNETPADWDIETQMKNIPNEFK